MENNEYLVADVVIRYSQKLGALSFPEETYHLELRRSVHKLVFIDIELKGPEFSQTFSLSLQDLMAGNGPATWPRMILKALVYGLYGEPYPSARIIGAPDWEEVNLKVMLHQKSQAPELLHRFCLKTISHQDMLFESFKGMSLELKERINTTKADADPLYALIRLGLFPPASGLSAVRSSNTHTTNASSQNPPEKPNDEYVSIY